MDDYVVSYYNPRTSLTVMLYATAVELLLRYFSENDIGNYYCGPEEGTFQLYYRLKNTGFSIQQCIFVDGGRYTCKTTVAEIHPQSPEETARLQAIIDSVNKKLDYGVLKYDEEKGNLQFWDRIILRSRSGAINLKNLFERFDRLIGYPHFVLDVEFADAFLDF